MSPWFKPIHLLAGALLLLASAGVSQAQDRILSDAARVSVLTILPGDAVYSMYGHSAIRVVDPALGLDRSYNYGTFDFDALFLPRFLYGKLDYFLSTYPFPRALWHYEQTEHRPVIEQVLNLDANRRELLFRFLEANALEENRYYRYDFLFDNCSTRIRDALRAVLGDDLTFEGPATTGATFRDLIGPYQPRALDAGIDLLLGTPVDRVAQPWETMFLPDYLMAGLEAATVRVDGRAVPLVARTDTLYWGDGRRATGDGLPWLDLALWLLFGVGVVATYRSYRTGALAVRALDVPLFVFAGFTGLLIVFLWFVSLHTVTAHNWNLLWAWPTHLVVAGVLLRRRRPSWLRGYLAASAVVALLFVAGWFAWPQARPSALLPLILLLALRSGWMASVLPRRLAEAPLTTAERVES